ncbi:MAG: ABC transporter ATP-binding protein [Chthonomonadales bacterium]
MPTPCTDLYIHLDHVSRRFGRLRVLDNVCASVRRGEVLVVTGCNGSGKSTLLRIIAGLLAPSSGQVHIRVNGSDTDRPARRSLMGYVAPDLALYPELTGVENLVFFARLRGITLDRERLASLLGSVGLKGRGRDLVGSYSSGMRQRLKYAFALLHEPPILLLDEPTANLDKGGVAMVQDILLRQRSRGTVVLATNEAAELMWGDAIVDLNAA